MNLHEIRAERNDHFLAAEALIKAAKDSHKDLTGDAHTEYEKHLAAMKTLDAQIAKCEQSGATALYDGRIPVGLVGGGVQSEGWTDPRTGQPVAVLKPEQKMSTPVENMGEPPLSIGSYLRGIITGKWNGAEREFRAMTEGTLGSGGYLVPTPLSGQIIDKVRNASVMIRAGARTIPMDTQTLSIARIAGDVTPQWHQESAALTASDMTFEKVTFTAQTLAALCSMSVELFEDASNIDAVVMDAISRVLAIEWDRACLRGSGTLPELKGIRNQSNVVIDSTTFTTNGSVISASAPTNAVGWDWLSKQVSALWGVNENPNAAIYSARTAGELDLLRATTGAVLPPPGSVADLQRLFTNSIPNNLTSGTNNDCSECYVGDFSQALIGMRRELALEVSRYGNVGANSAFTNMLVGIRVYWRGDFQLARPAAFRVVTGIR